MCCDVAARDLLMPYGEVVRLTRSSAMLRAARRGDQQQRRAEWWKSECYGVMRSAWKTDIQLGRVNYRCRHVMSVLVKGFGCRPSE